MCLSASLPPPALIDVDRLSGCGGRVAAVTRSAQHDCTGTPMDLSAGLALGQGPGPVGDVRVAPRCRKALVAEDNATVRVLVETIVRDLGFDVTAVSGGAEAQS